MRAVLFVDHRYEKAASGEIITGGALAMLAESQETGIVCRRKKCRLIVVSELSSLL